MTQSYRIKKISMILRDNAGYHKSEKILSFIKGTKITPHYLLPYSPNLNLIERLWKIMHEKVTYNRYYNKFADFTEAILGFFDNIELQLDVIKCRMNDNFQRLNFVYSKISDNPIAVACLFWQIK